MGGWTTLNYRIRLVHLITCRYLHCVLLCMTRTACPMSVFCRIDPAAVVAAMRSRGVSSATAGGLPLVWSLVTERTADLSARAWGSSAPSSPAASSGATDGQATAADLAYVAHCLQALRALGMLDHDWCAATPLASALASVAASEQLMIVGTLIQAGLLRGERLQLNRYGDGARLDVKALLAAEPSDPAARLLLQLALVMAPTQSAVAGPISGTEDVNRASSALASLVTLTTRSLRAVFEATWLQLSATPCERGAPTGGVTPSQLPFADTGRSTVGSGAWRNRLSAAGKDQSLKTIAWCMCVCVCESKAQ